MATIRTERTLFIFRAGMDVKNDLVAVRRSGWSILNGSQFFTREPDGTKIVNLFLFRLVRK